MHNIVSLNLYWVVIFSYNIWIVPNVGRCVVAIVSVIYFMKSDYLVIHDIVYPSFGINFTYE